MATFGIFEGDMKENARPDNAKLHVQKVCVPNKCSRIPMRIIGNKIQQDNKRIKLGPVEKRVEKASGFPIKPTNQRNQKHEVKKPKDIKKQVVAVRRTKEISVKIEDVVEDLHLHSEYLEDIWSHLMGMEKKVEWPKANYMKKQQHVNFEMRAVLVDWLAAVAVECKLSDQTLHLSVNYIDRFLSHMSIVREKVQLLGSAAMMLAGKVEDIYPPFSSEWSHLTNEAYTREQIQRMEILLLKVLQYNLQPPTMLTFIQHLCVQHELDKSTMYFAMYISELILLEGEDYLEHVPSKLAAACVALAQMTLSKKQPWPKKLQKASGYSLKQLSPVVQRQNWTFANSPSKQQQVIQAKYKEHRFHGVALLKPKVLNFDECKEE